MPERRFLQESSPAEISSGIMARKAICHVAEGGKAKERIMPVAMLQEREKKRFFLLSVFKLYPVIIVKFYYLDVPFFQDFGLFRKR